MAKITIKDVAKLANVDLSTVSRILNSSFDTHKYASATMHRVKKAAETLGYQPSLAARSLRTGKTMLLGLVVADISNPFFSNIASHLDRYIGEHGYRLVISSTNENPKRQEDHIEGMVAHGVDGLIVAPCGINGLNKASKARVPLITIDRPMVEVKLPFVGLDNTLAGRLLADKMIKCGYKSIGVVIPEASTDPTLKERLLGLQSGLDKNNCSLSWIVKVPLTTTITEDVRLAVGNKLTKTETPPDAIVGMTNVCTIGIIKALEDINIPWGDKLGLAGIDDFTAATVVRPAVSVVSQPLKEIASEAFSLLLSRIKNPETAQVNESIHVKPLWIERKSLQKIS